MRYLIIHYDIIANSILIFFSLQRRIHCLFFIYPKSDEYQKKMRINIFFSEPHKGFKKCFSICKARFYYILQRQKHWIHNPLDIMLYNAFNFIQFYWF